MFLYYIYTFCSLITDRHGQNIDIIDNHMKGMSNEEIRG